MITPLKDNNTLDIGGLERLIEHILNGGVHGLFILGTTGEFASLSYSIKYDLVKRVCSQVNNRVPILVGITDTSFAETVKLAEQATVSGADAVVVSPPYYFTSAQPELLEYFSHLVKQLPLPIIIYNIPLFTKIMIEPSTVIELASISNIIGIKDSSSDLGYLSSIQNLVENRPDFSLFVGIEELTAYFLLMGGHGGITGGANMFPKLYVDMYNAATEKNIDKLMPLHKKIIEVSNSIYHIGKYGSSMIKGIKCVLSLMGICSDFMAEPFHRFRQPERDIIQKKLKKINIDGYDNQYG